MRHRRTIIAGSVVLVVLLAPTAIVFLVPRSTFLAITFEHFTPGLVPSSRYAANLKSADPDLLRESLGLLKGRKDPVGLSDALPLLQSADDYVWLNAALYAAACGRQEAVPYLIKALRHTAWRTDPETVASLKTLTGQDFGTDFDKWRTWWEGQHPGQSFDWTSHLGFNPRVPRAQHP